MTTETKRDSLRSIAEKYRKNYTRSILGREEAIQGMIANGIHVIIAVEVLDARTADELETALNCVVEKSPPQTIEEHVAAKYNRTFENDTL